MPKKTGKSLRNSHKLKTVAAKKIKTTKNKVVVYAKKNPFKTIGFSALAGLILAQFMRHRHQ